MCFVPLIRMHGAGEAQWEGSDILATQEPLARRGGVRNFLISGCSTSGGGWCILQGGLTVVAAADTIWIPSQVQHSSLITITRDITEHKRAEVELMKHREHLEEPVKERTNELRMTNEQLQEEMTARRLTINDLS